MSAEVLLDTNVLLWLAAGTRRRDTGAVRALLDDAESMIVVSAASWWEIAIKASIGKLAVEVDELRREALLSGIEELPVTGQHASMVQRLPLHHRDPFDRILIAQAIVERLVIATADRQFSRYDGVQTM